MKRKKNDKINATAINLETKPPTCHFSHPQKQPPYPSPVDLCARRPYRLPSPDPPFLQATHPLQPTANPPDTPLLQRPPPALHVPSTCKLGSGYFFCSRPAPLLLLPAPAYSCSVPTSLSISATLYPLLVHPPPQSFFLFLLTSPPPRASLLFFLCCDFFQRRLFPTLSDNSDRHFPFVLYQTLTPFAIVQPQKTARPLSLIRDDTRRLVHLSSPVPA